MCASVHVNTQLTFTSNGIVAIKSTGAYNAWVLEHRAKGQGWINAASEPLAVF